MTSFVGNGFVWAECQDLKTPLSVWSIHLRRQIQHYLTLTVNKYNYSIIKTIFLIVFLEPPFPKKNTVICCSDSTYGA